MAKIFNRDKVEVIAIAKSGAGALQERINLESLGLRYSPDLVTTLLTPLNDFRDDAYLAASLIKNFIESMYLSKP